MHIIIPLSGIGKRFIDAGYTIPKPLIMIEGKPIIEHVVNLFPNETKFTFICNDLHLKQTNMRETLLNIKPFANIIELSVENRRGPVCAILQANNIKNLDDNEEIIISYCDYGTQWSYNEFINKIRETNVDGAIACYKGFHPHMLGTDNYAFVKEENMYLIEIQEKKPFTENRMNEFASNGTYYFKNGAIVKKYFKELVDKNISINNEYYVSLVYNLMKRDNLKTLIFQIKKMLQWGTPKDLEEYLMWSNYFLNRDKNFNNHKDTDNTNNTTLILPMAGAGSRFYNVGYKEPKPLLQIEGEPMIIKAVECLPKTFKKIFICQNKHLNEYKIKDTILSKYPESEIFGIDYLTEGQASTCEIAFKLSNIQLDNPLLISACDNGVYYNVKKYEELVKDPDVDIIIWSFSNHVSSKLNPNMYAWLDVDENNYIKRTSIKKPFTDCVNKYAIIGTMFFKKAKYFLEGLKCIYDMNIRTNGEFYVDNMIESLIKKGYKIKIFDVDYYLCWGTPNDYKTYNYWLEYFTSIGS